MDDGEVHPARLVVAIIIYSLETLGHTHNTTSCLAPAPPPPLIYSANTLTWRHFINTVYGETGVCVCVCLCVCFSYNPRGQKLKFVSLSETHQFLHLFTQSINYIYILSLNIFTEGMPTLSAP
ncbi:hypothetical protein XENOCAPTIV_024442 [Xenoophorus captivus]|uniref:Uncharacterized protein n=1 Tax=Xenoophorus captivus TaxID=1517983 RepID=A0ABV0Q610_9TELE